MSALIRWSPFLEPFEEMEKFFSDVPAVRANQSGYVPAVDMYEKEDKVIIEAQLAGIDIDNVDVSIENNVVSIKGKSEKKTEVEDKNYYRKEIKRGSFYRSITLPIHVDGDKTEAIVADGVLKITIPKVDKIKPKTIKIQTKKK